MLSQEQNDLITRVGPGTAAGGLMRRYWQPVGAGGRDFRRQPADQAGAAARRRPGAVPQRRGPLRPGRAQLSAPRHRSRLWAAGERWAALRLPRLAVRRQRPMPGDAGRAGRLEPLRQHPAEGLSGGGEERHPVRLYGSGRAAGVSAFRLLRRARHPHLRVQGADRLQLAAIAGGRHRSGAHLVPAPLLPRRGSEGRLRQAVPRHLDRFRNADDQDHARVSAPDASRSSRPTSASASSRCARSATATRTSASPT